MTIYQMFTLLFAVSLPIAVVLSLFAGVALVWFVYGVAHTKKGILEDLILLTVPGVLIYGGGYGLWRLARFMDAKPGDKTN
jgi:hypothetical protein